MAKKKANPTSYPGTPTKEPEAYDQAEFDQDKQLAQQLITDHADREPLFKEIEEAVFMEPEDVSFLRRPSTPPDDLKLTYSPDARNRLKGAIRLVTATEPEFVVARDLNNPNAYAYASDLEKMAKVMWMASSRHRRYPLHYDGIEQGMTYGRMIYTVTDVEDLIEQAEGGTPAQVARVRKLASRTPYYIQAHHVPNCYSYDDEHGLSSWLERKKVRVGLIYDQWGGDARRILGPNLPRHHETYLSNLWTLERHSVWLDMAGEPLLMGWHNLETLPICDQIIEGSLLYSKPHHRAQPWLYTLIKSGLWKRQSLGLTVWYTLLFQLGNSPMLIANLVDPSRPLRAVDSEFGKILALGINERIAPGLKDVLDPNLASAIDLAERKGTESTMYPQALGEPLGGQTPYAAVALLHQAGRLPLIGAQKLGGWGLGEVAEIALRWLKEKGKVANASYGSWSAELNPQDIPDDFQIEGRLEIKLPQDRVQAGAIARALSEGENPVASKRWVQEEVLGIGQPEALQEEIWSEQAAQLRAATYFAEQMAALNQAMARAAGEVPPGEVPPGDGADMEAPPGRPLTPEEQALAAQAGEAQAAPVARGMGEPSMARQMQLQAGRRRAR